MDNKLTNVICCYGDIIVVSCGIPIICRMMELVREREREREGEYWSEEEQPRSQGFALGDYWTITTNQRPETPERFKVFKMILLPDSFIR